MNITRAKLKETLRTIVNEESEYQSFFKAALEKAGKSIPEMSEEEKKAFFNKIDAAWDAKGEKNEALVGNQHKLDVDGDGDIEADDLADLRAGKTADESVNEIQYKDAVEKFNKELIKHPMIKKAAQHYKKTPADIVKVLQQRISTKGDRAGQTKEISIDFKDTDSGIVVKHKMKFTESVNEENPGLWANIRAKKARGEKPAHGNSDAHKDAVKAGKKINKEESANEGKKRFKQQDGIGSSKYTISFHDGKKKHKDGSDFFDIKIFKNKQDLEAFKKELLSNKYVSESVNEAPDAKKRFMFDFYTDSNQRNTERETNFMATTLESAIKAAEHMCKVTGYAYVEIYYKDLFLGSMKKQNGFKFVEGRGYPKFKSIN
jgi:hypothetical protein